MEAMHQQKDRQPPTAPIRWGSELREAPGFSVITVKYRAVPEQSTPGPLFDPRPVRRWSNRDDWIDMSSPFDDLTVQADEVEPVEDDGDLSSLVCNLSDRVELS